MYGRLPHARHYSHIRDTMEKPPPPQDTPLAQMGRESMVRGGSGEVRKDARGSKDRQRVSGAREAGEGFPEEGISESLLKREQELGKQRLCEG